MLSFSCTRTCNTILHNMHVYKTKWMWVHYRMPIKDGSAGLNQCERKMTSGKWSQEHDFRKMISGKWSQEHNLRKKISGKWSKENDLRKMTSGKWPQEHDPRKVISGTWSQENDPRKMISGKYDIDRNKQRSWKKKRMKQLHKTMAVRPGLMTKN